MFIREMALYLDYVKSKLALGREQFSQDTLRTIVDNLAGGVRHYRGLAEQRMLAGSKRFLAELELQSQRIARLQAMVSKPQLGTQSL